MIDDPLWMTSNAGIPAYIECELVGNAAMRQDHVGDFRNFFEEVAVTQYDDDSERNQRPLRICKLSGNFGNDAATTALLF